MMRLAAYFSLEPMPTFRSGTLYYAADFAPVHHNLANLCMALGVPVPMAPRDGVSCLPWVNTTRQAINDCAAKLGMDIHLAPKEFNDFATTALFNDEMVAPIKALYEAYIESLSSGRTC